MAYKSKRIRKALDSLKGMLEEMRPYLHKARVHPPKVMGDWKLPEQRYSPPEKSRKIEAR